MKYCIRPSPWPQDQKQYTRLSVSYPSFAWLLSPDVTTTSTPAPACLVNGILSAALSGLHLTHNVTIHLIGHELFCNRPTNMAVHDSHETHSERHSQASCNAVYTHKRICMLQHRHITMSNKAKPDCTPVWLGVLKERLHEQVRLI